MATVSFPKRNTANGNGKKIEEILLGIEKVKSELAQFSEEYEEKVDDPETLDMLTGALESLDDAIDLIHDALL